MQNTKKQNAKLQNKKMYSKYRNTELLDSTYDYDLSPQENSCCCWDFSHRLPQKLTNTEYKNSKYKMQNTICKIQNTKCNIQDANK